MKLIKEVNCEVKGGAYKDGKSQFRSFTLG